MKIDVQENFKNGGINFSSYPDSYKYFGKDAGEGDLKVFIEIGTLGEIDNYLSSDTENELGGVLVGDVCNDTDGRNFILINGQIIAKHTNSSLSRLTFTHDTWEYINSVLEKDFPGKKILGWFHSHPGHTVFLSTFDVFIQENFFNLEYMVAYVFDPTIKDRGFFFWKDKKIVKASGFYIYDIKKKDEFFNLPDTLNSQNLTPDGVNTSKKPPLLSLKDGIIFALLLLNILLTILFVYNFIEFKKTVLMKDEFAKEVSEMKTENKKLSEQLNNFIIETELKANLPQDSILTK